MTPAVSSAGLRVAGLLLALLPASGVAADCLDYTNHMHWLGEYSNGHYINDVAVSGNYACIAETAEFAASARFRLLDVSDPQAPLPLSMLELGGISSRGIAVTGSIAYVATISFGATRIVDFTNPMAPVVVGTISGGSDVCVVGNRAYTVGIVAGMGSRLKIWNITNPRAPTLLGSVVVAGETVEVSGNHAYIGDDEFGLRIVDVSNSATPLVVGSLPLPQGAFQVSASGSFAFVASWGDGLIVVDVSDPAQPVIAGSVGGLTAVGVAIEGTTAFVAGSLRAIDISNPAQPVIIGRVPSSLGRVTLAGGKAYVASETSPVSGLTIVDITATTGVAPLGNLAMTPEPLKVAASDGLALLLDEAGLKIVNVMGKTPDLTGEVALPNGRDVASLGDYAIVVAGASGLQVVDVHDPPNAAIVASLSTPGQSSDVALDGDIAYVADASALRIIDLSNPLAPVLLRATGASSSQVAVSDGLAYTYDQSVLRIFDISNPSAPVQLSSLSVPQGGDIAASSRHAFVLTSNGLKVVDATDPVQPIIAATLGMPAGGGNIAVDDGVAYVAGSISVSRSYVQVVDISDPESPWHRGGAYEFQNPRDVAVGPNGLLLATTFGLYLFPAQCPLTTAVQASAATRSVFLRIGPNPMQAQLTARLALPAPAVVSFAIYDVQGRMVRELISGQRTSGEHVAIWDGRSDRGQRAANGVYWLRLDWPGGTATEPVTILR